jgi:hypothetical protein
MFFRVVRFICRGLRTTGGERKHHGPARHLHEGDNAGIVRHIDRSAAAPEGLFQDDEPIAGGQNASLKNDTAAATAQ